MKNDERKEFVYYYESRQNPNGDPGFENQPRLLPDGRILVTDVRLKRTIRDYAKKKKIGEIFVGYNKKGDPVTADKKLEEMYGDKSKKSAIKLLSDTYDVPLFGALVPIRGNKKDDGSSFKITGPVQFALGKSVNQVEIIEPTITSHFVGKEKGKGKEHGSFGKFFSVNYALIKFQGAINPANLMEYWEDKKIMKNFNNSEEMLFDCIWNGANELVTRSKYPQRSVLFIEITYENALFNDIGTLIKEDERLSGKAERLIPESFDFSEFIETLVKRKKKIKKIRMAFCEEMENKAKDAMNKLSKKGIKVEELK